LDQLEGAENVVSAPEVFGSAIAWLEQQPPFPASTRESADGEPPEGADLAGGQAWRQVWGKVAHFCLRIPAMISAIGAMLADSSKA